MVPSRSWVQTDVHRASTYSCMHCGKEFKTPHAVYDHLDEGCEPVDDEIKDGSRVRMTKATGIVSKVKDDTVHVEWDTGARSSVPMAWLTRED